MRAGLGWPYDVVRCEENVYEVYVMTFSMPGACLLYLFGDASAVIFTHMFKNTHIFFTES